MTLAVRVKNVGAELLSVKNQFFLNIITIQMMKSFMFQEVENYTKKQLNTLLRYITKPTNNYERRTL